MEGEENHDDAHIYTVSAIVCIIYCHNSASLICHHCVRLMFYEDVVSMDDFNDCKTNVTLSLKSSALLIRSIPTAKLVLWAIVSRCIVRSGTR